MGTLVLGRRVGESIEIGPDVVVTVKRYEDGRCRLAIHIRRAELKPLPHKGAQP